MPLIIKSWLNETNYKINEVSISNPFYTFQWLNFIRIQAYELFMYHYEFKSKDYNDISTFLKEDYNILGVYCHNEKIYGNVTDDVPLSSELKRRIKFMRMIRNNIFIKVNKESINRWLNSGNMSDEDYLKILGMDKKTFEKLVIIYENESKKSDEKGGRPSSLDVRDKVILLSIYTLFNRTMDDMGVDFGVGKTQIYEAIKWNEKMFAEFRKNELIADDPDISAWHESVKKAIESAKTE